MRGWDMYSLLLLSLTCYLKPTIGFQVQELEGVITINETVNLHRIQDHLHLWITELSASNEKLDKLQAAAMMRDSTLLIETILQMTGQEKIKIELKTQKLTDNNQYTRYKRNILGDFLSAVTGVATEDELQKQMKIDNEIRDKVVEVLGRQVTFEKSITAYYTNLTREEEQMHKRIDAIANQRTRDRNQLSRIMVLTAIAQDDIKDMEDILEILWTGRVPARHAIKLSKYAKLPRVALFNFNRATPGQEGPVMQYSTRTYYNSKAKVIEYGLTYTEIQTDHNLYLLHPGHDLSTPIMEIETILTGSDCSTCALLVHIEGTMYKVVQGGELTCADKKEILTQGTLFNINTNDTCHNAAMKVDMQRGIHKEYVLNSQDEDRLDNALLQRSLDKNKLSMPTPREDEKNHRLISFKLQHEVLQAQQDLDTFITDTKTDMTVQYSHSLATWGVIGGIGTTLFTILMCIAIRYKQNKRDTTNTVILASPPSSATHN